MAILYKILRTSAWLLMLATVIALFSGFFTTKYFLFPQLGYSFSYYIHTVIIPFIFIPLFFLHSLAGILVLIARHGGLNRKSFKTAAGLSWAGIFLTFIFLYLMQNPASTSGTYLNQTGSVSLLNSSSIILSSAEVSRHNLASDCWLIINGKVYDITTYLDIHPGGPEIMLPYCGRDGTNAFATKDMGKSHSNNAVNLLGSFFIGNLNESVSGQKVQNITASLKKPPRLEDDDD